MSLSLPFIKFYPNDWLSDQGLRMCSIAARGVWIELLCLMWKAPRRGYLEANEGTAISEAQLSRIIGESPDKVKALIDELEKGGVFSREEGTGIIFSRRIVKDVAFLTACSEAGRKGGGNPTFKGTSKGPDKGSPKPQKSEVRSQKLETESSDPASAKRMPTLAEWIVEANAMHPDWPEADAKSAWNHYEAGNWYRGKTKLTQWRRCIATCYSNYVGKASGGRPISQRTDPTLKEV